MSTEHFRLCRCGRKPILSMYKDCTGSGWNAHCTCDELPNAMSEIVEGVNAPTIDELTDKWNELLDDLCPMP